MADRQRDVTGRLASYPRLSLYSPLPTRTNNSVVTPLPTRCFDKNVPEVDCAQLTPAAITSAARKGSTKLPSSTACRIRRINRPSLTVATVTLPLQPVVTSNAFLVRHRPLRPGTSRLMHLLVIAKPVKLSSGRCVVR